MDELRCALEWREDASRASPGRLVGTLLEYETRAVDREEVFKAGALEWPPDGVILNSQSRPQTAAHSVLAGSARERRHGRSGVAGHVARP